MFPCLQERHTVEERRPKCRIVQEEVECSQLQKRPCTVGVTRYNEQYCGGHQVHRDAERADFLIWGVSRYTEQYCGGHRYTEQYCRGHQVNQTVLWGSPGKLYCMWKIPGTLYCTVTRYTVSVLGRDEGYTV